MSIQHETSNTKSNSLKNTHQKIIRKATYEEQKSYAEIRDLYRSLIEKVAYLIILGKFPGKTLYAQIQIILKYYRAGPVFS